jgi:hypothetical protein
VESSERRVVYEIPLIASEAKGATLTASRVNLNDQWQDSGTTRIRFAD